MDYMQFEIVGGTRRAYLCSVVDRPKSTQKRKRGICINRIHTYICPKMDRGPNNDRTKKKYYLGVDHLANNFILFFLHQRVRFARQSPSSVQQQTK